MKPKEKKGVALIVAIFLVLAVILYYTTPRPEGPVRSIQDNVLIDQRMKNRNLN